VSRNPCAPRASRALFVLPFLLAGCGDDGTRPATPANTPTEACFTVVPAHGTLATKFVADATCSADLEDPPESLEVRWDWEGDGTWDTPWSHHRQASHRYPTRGRKRLQLEVRDSAGLTGAARDSFEVGIDYLGQESASLIPQVAVPAGLRANALWFWHGSPVFSPDGTEMFFTKYFINPVADYVEMQVLRFVDGAWSAPQRAPFSDRHFFDNNPFYSAGGDTLYFFSNRNQGFLFYVTRVGGGWSQPTPLYVSIPSGMRPGMQFSITRDHTLYGELNQDDNLDIYRWDFRGGQFVSPQRLGNGVNTECHEFMPCVDPEGRWLLFSSLRPRTGVRNRLYLSRRAEDGTWSEAELVGAGVNGDWTAGWPVLSPDGKHIFFGSDRECGALGFGYEPFWVAASAVVGSGG
jgi:hypothetical protein